MTVTNAWSGALTHQGARVIAKVTTTTNVRLAVSTSPSMTSPTFFGPAVVTAQNIADFTATGLAAGTTYHWAVDENGTMDATFRGKFTTFSAAVGNPVSFRFAASGCAGGVPETQGTGAALCVGRLSNHAVFASIEAKAPQFFAHLGDLHYYNIGGTNPSCADITATLTNARRAIDDVLLQPNQHSLYRNIPLEYIWDDHDYGPNNSDSTSPSATITTAVFRERVPSYPLGNATSTNGVYHAFQIGRVQFIATDTRRHRSPDTDPDTPTKTMLGATQLSWLEGVLDNSTSEALIWLNPTNWLGDGDGGDSWGAFSYARTEVKELFGDHGWLNRMCVISSNMHGSGIASEKNNDHGGFPVYHLGSLDSQAASGQTYFDIMQSLSNNQYGMIHVTDTGGVVHVNVQPFQGTAEIVKNYAWESQTGGKVFGVPALSYTSRHLTPPFEPVEDDQRLANDVTVSREDGSSARVTKETGPLSIEDAGLYDEQVDLVAFDDTTLADQAGWRVHLGTWDEQRWPAVTVDMTRTGFPLAFPKELVAELDSGSKVDVTNLPTWLVDATAELELEGYAETLEPFRWQFAFASGPDRPWQVMVADHVTFGRADATGSTLNADITSVATSLSVASPSQHPTLANILWVTAAGEFPLDIIVGGEVIRVTAIAGATSPQTFTVTRSVNGVVKAHSAGAPVVLAQPAIAAL